MNSKDFLSGRINELKKNSMEVHTFRPPFESEIGDMRILFEEQKSDREGIYFSLIIRELSLCYLGFWVRKRDGH